MQIQAAAVRKLNKEFKRAFDRRQQTAFLKRAILYLTKSQTKDGYPANVSGDIYLIINHSRHFRSRSKESGYIFKICDFERAS